MQTAPSRIYSLNECAITIEFGNEIREDINREVITWKSIIVKNAFDGLIEVVTAYTTVTVFYDPNQVFHSSVLIGGTASEKVHWWLRGILKKRQDVLKTASPPRISIPVCYDEEFAPDLPWLADFHKTTSEEIIRKHTAHEYRVFMIGFTPGFPYMGMLPPELQTPRKQTPRTKVPAGSVGIAGRQTGIYSFETPGGWQIIGRTPLKLFLPDKSQPSLFKAGDLVSFEQISREDFFRQEHE